MGSVIKLRHFLGKHRLYFGIFAIYFIAGFAFLAIGLQPIKNSSAVYATEAETAEESLEIPSINLSAPVKIASLSGSDLIVPEQIAGSYSIHRNKTLLFGHSSTIFRDLKSLATGDLVIYNDASYKITTITEKAKADIDMEEILSAKTTPTIILMTCSGDLIPNTNGDHTHRLIITAEKI